MLSDDALEGHTLRLLSCPTFAKLLHDMEYGSSSNRIFANRLSRKVLIKFLKGNSPNYGDILTSSEQNVAKRMHYENLTVRAYNVDDLKCFISPDRTKMRHKLRKNVLNHGITNALHIFESKSRIKFIT